MSLRKNLVLRTAIGSIAPLAACVLVACSGAGGEGTAGTTTEDLSRSGPGVFHSGITRQAFHGACGIGNRHEFDDGFGCLPLPLDMCPYLDSQFIGVDGGAACTHETTDNCPDRVDSWDDAIVFAFASASSSDCRFGQWGPPLFTSADVATFLNDLLAFTLQFFGCPEEPGTTGPLTFGLIPEVLAGHRFTTADLDALSDTYVSGVETALSENGSPPLTFQQEFLIRARLHRLARRVPNVVPSSKFTFSTCAADAGEPAADPFGPEDVNCF